MDMQPTPTILALKIEHDFYYIKHFSLVGCAHRVQDYPHNSDRFRCAVSGVRILLLGAGGQLGQALSIALLDGKSDWQLIAPDRDECRLVDHCALMAFIGLARPDVIINAAAYTKSIKRRVSQSWPIKINAQPVTTLAEAARRVGALLVHFSTDYVFDGGGDRPWREEDRPAPLNVYGLEQVARRSRPFWPAVAVI